MFKGLSKDWPVESYIAPEVRSAEDGEQDCAPVTADYLDYHALGYSPREVDLFDWLEALRNEQCEDPPRERGAAPTMNATVAATRP
jgi:glutamate synthase (NADPH/NADH) small chain